MRAAQLAATEPPQAPSAASGKPPGIAKRVLSTALAAGVGLALNQLRHGSGTERHASVRRWVGTAQPMAPRVSGWSTQLL
jgi:hypothetical protein